jgi:sterol desaturase/sphingolipid hydroxylase (fatty acid hydroxylase superfamily)
MNVPLIVVAAGLLMVLVEQIWPAWRRPINPGWLGRGLSLSALQALVAFVGAATWDRWFGHAALVDLSDQTGTVAVAVGYLLVTLVYYWWHRARHVVPPLWRYLHRVHHSPSRIEILTSFYKHPLELLANAVLTSALLYFVLGLPPVLVSATVLLTGLAELIYHWNIRTPRWLGWFFQRPEMHRVHHARGSHTHNFSDLPVWDALFGTLLNPRDDVAVCGFPQEEKLVELLAGKPVVEV